ncbi:MAG: YdcF family protein [Pseudoramibacter sp.]
MTILIILAAASAVYGVLVWHIASGSRFYRVWWGLAVVLGAAALGVHIGIFAKMPVIGQHLLEGLILVAAAGALILLGLVLTQFHAKAPDDLDVLIVLGAQVRPDGPCRALAYRLDTAAAYLSAHPQTRCVVSGGQGDNEPKSEAAAMARVLVQKGIAPERIALEDQSTSTVENLRFSAKVIDQNRRVGIVTNDFHLYRSLKLAKKAGYTAVFGLAAPSTTLYLPNNVLREIFGLVKDKLAGNI